MKTKFLSVLLIPVWIAFLGGAGCLYWHSKFDAVAHLREVQLTNLQDKLKAIECPSLNKDGVLLMARQSVEQTQGYGDLFEKFGIILLGIGGLNFALVWGHLKSQSRNAAPHSDKGVS